MLSSEEGLTPGEREYGETFSAFLLSPFAEWRRVFAEQKREAERQAKEEESENAAFGFDVEGSSSKPKGTEGLFED
ncbi:MAG: hypothetical protein EBZ48_15130 [Proteobacteria bacterium]|nr:hypothetical protein [Pseudomonadota bacterium]